MQQQTDRPDFDTGHARRNYLSARRSPVCFGIWLLTILATTAAFGADIVVSDEGEGCDYMSAAAITLPAARLGTNLFGNGVRPVLNRAHIVKPAAFDSAGALSHAESATASVFPPYLEGKPYVSFLQDVRRYTNYSCTVTATCPVTFYLLVDNRVNDFAEYSSLDDPSFGPPDTEWIPRDGWARVNTGLSPKTGGASRADYVCFYEGGVGAISQFYAIYSKDFAKGGSVTLRTQYEGNIYCLVVATNSAPESVKAPEVPKPPQPRAGG